MNQRNFLSNPSGSILKPILLLSAILLVLWVITISQTGDSETDLIAPTSQYDQAQLDSVRVLLGTTDATPNASKDTSLIGKAFPVFVLLMILIGGLWWWSLKAKPKSNVLTNVVAEQEIGPGQFIKVVSLGDEYLVLGVTGQSINLLKSISKQDWQPLVEPTPMKTESLFSQIMKRAEGKDEN